jgi:hypothetical protein
MAAVYGIGFVSTARILTGGEMQTTTLDQARKELGEKLRRGNGGSYESDLSAIRNAAYVWMEGDVGLERNTPVEIATRFAMWVLYSFHSNNQNSEAHIANPNI